MRSLKVLFLLLLHDSHLELLYHLCCGLACWTMQEQTNNFIYRIFSTAVSGPLDIRQSGWNKATKQILKVLLLLVRAVGYSLPDGLIQQEKVLKTCIHGPARMTRWA